MELVIRCKQVLHFCMHLLVLLRLLPYFVVQPLFLKLVLDDRFLEQAHSLPKLHSLLFVAFPEDGQLLVVQVYAPFGLLALLG